MNLTITRRYYKRNYGRRRCKLAETQAALADQFHDLAQQHEIATFGMWVFLATEVLLFGALFLSYTVYRTTNAAAFTDASHHISTPIGALNTAILIASSL